MTKYKLAISLGLLIFHTVYSSDYESAENKIDNVDDNYDTIIVNDVADVLNDYGNDDFEEEDKNTASSNNFYQLLAEYQKYVDKAVKDKKKSAEKNLGKPRYSLYRKENNANNNFLATKYTDDYYPSEVPTTKKKNYLFDNMVINPLGLIPTFGPKNEGYYENEPKQKVHRTSAPALVQTYYDKDMISSPATYKKKSLDPSNCYCPDYTPCNCGCPKCYYFTTQTQLKVPYEYSSSPYARSYSPYETPGDSLKVFDTMLRNFQSVYFIPQEPTPTAVKDNAEKTLNINIKVEIQMPNKDKDNKTTNATGARNVCNKLFSLPFPYFSMPFETDLKKVEKPKKHEVSIQKVTVHKKRKNKANNTLKKNRKKTNNVTEENASEFFNPGSFFNSIQQHGDFGSDLSKQITTKPNDGLNNDSAEFDNNFRSFVADSRAKIPDNNTIITTNATTLKDYDFMKKDNIFVDFTSQASVQLNQTESPIHVAKNISKIRARRDTHFHEGGYQESQYKSYEQVTGEHEKETTKKIVHDDLPSGLLYWPSVNDKKLSSKHAFGKLQKIYTTIKENYNDTLEKTSFGKINWSDVDTVAPILISFMGRYLNGMLTFCSAKVCHSINCGHQQCLYRVCKKELEYSENHHCNGSKDIDYKYKIESKVEPQPKIMFEAYDVLRTKFEEILFGKATLCVKSKCMTVAASKQKTSSTECGSKQLIDDHCPMDPQTNGG